MDPRKKKDLNPELKAIYERVMNTQVAPRSAPTQTPPPPSQQTPQKPQPQQQQQPNPSPVTASPSATTPIDSGSSDTFLSSVPPRPISTSSQPFVFSSKGGVKNSDEKKESSRTTPYEGKKMPSTKIIILLGVVFVIVYGLFWAKLFGLF